MSLVIRRLVAFVLDWVVLFVVFVAPQFVLAVVLDTWVLDYDSPPLLSWAWVTLTVSVPGWIYFVLSDSSATGASLGKRLIGLAVRDESGERLSRGRALVRTAVKLLPWEATHIMVFFPEPFGEELTTTKIVMMVVVDVLLLVWLAAPFLDRSRHRALHDRAAGSAVLDTGVQ